jgi:hypothetical protein
MTGDALTRNGAVASAAIDQRILGGRIGYGSSRSAGGRREASHERCFQVDAMAFTIFADDARHPTDR